MKLLNTPFDLKNLYIKRDEKTGLVAIIALHNLKNGPALGGCRFVSYPSVDDAIADAMKLAKAMTYKSAMAGLPLGGGKSVIISHDGIKDRKKLFEAFGEFVNELKGEYITASDSGSGEEDMRIIATKTKHVTSINRSSDHDDDTAYMTSLGMVRAIESAVAEGLGKADLKGVHVAIQGIGSVGFLLMNMLLEKGALITITDKNQALLTERTKGLAVNTVAPEQIFEIECDVLSPCALGGILTPAVIEKIKAPIVCGAANNQLQSLECGDLLKNRHILYVPDYVANAGGVICAASQAGVITKDESHQKVNDIFDLVKKVVTRAKELNLSTQLVANQIAEERFM